MGLSQKAQSLQPETQDRLTNSQNPKTKHKSKLGEVLPVAHNLAALDWPEACDRQWPLGHDTSASYPNIEELIIRSGFGGMLYCNYIVKEPQEMILVIISARELSLHETLYGYATPNTLNPVDPKPYLLNPNLNL